VPAPVNGGVPHEHGRPGPQRHRVERASQRPPRVQGDHDQQDDQPTVDTPSGLTGRRPLRGRDRTSAVADHAGDSRPPAEAGRGQPEAEVERRRVSSSSLMVASGIVACSAGVLSH
jgi:hypothetical protein